MHPDIAITPVQICGATSKDMDCHGAATLAPLCRSVTAIAHPTDSRLLEVARVKIVRLAQRACIKLKLTHKQGLIVGARTLPGNGNLRLAQAAG